MSTITIPNGTVGAGGKGVASLYGRTSKTLYKIVDLVNAAAVKGSALAQNDVIESVAIPANSRIESVFVRCIEAADVDTLLVDVGTGVDADAYVDGASMTATGLLQPTLVAQGIPQVSQSGTGTITITGTGTLNYTSTYDTVDITIMTYTGTVPTTGQLAVFVNIQDLSDPVGGANIADVQ